jgi:hypothetical protein
MARDTINKELMRQHEAEFRRGAERRRALASAREARPPARAFRVAARLLAVLLARRARSPDLIHGAGRAGRIRRRLSN